MDTRPTERPLGICVAKLQFLCRKWDIIMHENDLKIGENLPCDSRSTNGMFLFQSCYAVGCPAVLTLISGAGVEQEAYVMEGRFVSWYEEVFLEEGVVCVYI
jgi:hypothetical protein